MKNWYLVHTKIRQEQIALDNLQRQGYESFLPLIPVEKLRKSKLQVVQEPLFPRYLFVRLGDDLGSQSWAPIRSTLGVSRLVKFGQTPAKVDEQLVEEIRVRTLDESVQKRQFEAGDQVVINKGPFAGVDALFQSAQGEERVVVLLTMLSKQVKMTVSPADIRRVS